MTTGAEQMPAPPNLPGVTPMNTKTVTVTLEEPIVRGDQKIESLALRKPTAGELRGIKLADLLHSDVGSVLALLPRISSPTLTPQEAANLDTADLAAVAGEVIGFFMTRTQRAALSS